jgi:hypothetical protein
MRCQVGDFFLRMDVIGTGILFNQEIDSFNGLIFHTPNRQSNLLGSKIHVGSTVAAN